MKHFLIKVLPESHFSRYFEMGNPDVYSVFVLEFLLTRCVGSESSGQFLANAARKLSVDRRKAQAGATSWTGPLTAKQHFDSCSTTPTQTAKL